MAGYIRIGDIKGESTDKGAGGGDTFEFNFGSKPGSNDYTEVEWTYSTGGGKSGDPKVGGGENGGGKTYTEVEWTYTEGPQDMGDDLA